MKPHSLIGLAFAALAMPLYAAPVTDERFKEVAEQTFRPIIEEYNLPGLAIGVTLDGRQYVFTTGMADQARNAPVGPDTIFELGSVSKLFNVTLAALAEDMGALSLNAPVSQVMPQLEGSAFD